MSEIIPVERLTKPTDVFRCTPLNATISARTCLARRGAKYTGGRTLGHAPKEHTAFLGCQSCELGAKVAAQVQQRCFYSLEAPVIRVTGYDVPYPPSRIEEDFLPDLDRVLDAVDRSLAY